MFVNRLLQLCICDLDYIFHLEYNNKFVLKIIITFQKKRNWMNDEVIKKKFTIREGCFSIGINANFIKRK